MQPVLKIDLTSGQVETFEIPKDWEREYLGGASLATRMLYDTLTKELDPLSPQSPLLFITGPLTGTSGPTTGRFVVCAKSPATGLWSESNCGGFWGPELRKTGFDGIWITGKSEVPIFLWIEDGKLEILSAEKYWGLDTYEIQSAINAALNAGKVRVAGIGVAGEVQLPFAGIFCDHGRAAGRTGLGAIMGSKNLKAIAVKGSGRIPVHDPERFENIRSLANRTLREDNMTELFHELGSAGGADYFDYLGEMPKRGFTRGYMDGAGKISGASIAEQMLVGYSACHACVVACGRVVQLEGSNKTQKGPEYETLVGFGPNLWIDDPIAITRFGDICDRYGMDVISVSNTISLAFTLFEVGAILNDDTGGLELKWGDTDVIEKLLHLIPRRKGFGAYLAEGAQSLAKRFGYEELAVQVNGLEVPYHDPRGGTGMALVYATSPRGACHNQSNYYMVDLGQVEDKLEMEFFKRHDGPKKAGNVVKHQNWRTVHNALILCKFGNVSPDFVIELINAGCGLDWTIEDLLEAGERAWNLKRAINNRLGLTRKNDKLPKTLLEPLPDGGSAGFILDFEPMLKAYYQVRDWDWDTGFPSREKLKSLNLSWVTDDLWGPQ
ncbi:MAG: aldehyde ferredoxin oxidoreductase family protein [Anaerolineales bacterium]|jgi:aldehyde:ferredoxin oxidoreductase